MRYVLVTTIPRVISTATSKDPSATLALLPGQVMNVITWDGETPYQPPEDTRIVQSDALNTGDTTT